MPHRRPPIHALAILLALAAGCGEFLALQAWRLRDRLPAGGVRPRLRA